MIDPTSSTSTSTSRSASASPEAALEGGAWADLFRNGNALRTLALCGAVVLHALNLYVAATILPSVVREIGGIEYYAWNTSLFVVGSIIGAALCGTALNRFGPRASYSGAAIVFAAGSLLCALAPLMQVLIAGRIVQGLGGGMLLALPYAMARMVFPSHLWPRSIALLSGMWGVATLLGPAFGGALAEAGLWRAAFGMLVPVAVAFAALARYALPVRGNALPLAPIPLGQISLLACGVLAISIASVAQGKAVQALGLIAGVAALAILVGVEGRAQVKLLPRDALRLRAPLGALYATMALLAVTVTCTEVFVPLFLQELHALGPLGAGMLAAVMSAGWTAGSIAASGVGNVGRVRAIRLAPWLCGLGMIALTTLVPTQSSGEWLRLAPIALALIGAGAGVGIAWPHLAALVMQAAPNDETDLASASIMTVQLVATALAAALAGMVLNMSGIASPEGAANAARWLLALVVVMPLASLLLPVRPSAAQRFGAANAG